MTAVTGNVCLTARGPQKKPAALCSTRPFASTLMRGSSVAVSGRSGSSAGPQLAAIWTANLLSSISTNSPQLECAAIGILGTQLDFENSTLLNYALGMAGQNINPPFFVDQMSAAICDNRADG